MDLLRYNSHYRVVICTRCQFAVVGAHLNTHLATRHPEISVQERHELIAHFRPLCPLPQANIQVPTAPIPYIPDLKLFRESYQCTKCCDAGSIYQSFPVLKRHLKRAHNWVNPEHRGGNRKGVKGVPKPTTVGPWRWPVPSQRLFLSGESSSFFEVIPPANLSSTPEPTPINATLDQFERQLEPFQAQMEAAIVGIAHQTDAHP